VIFVTAHASGENAPDWPALVKTRMTLVVYMGIARCATVQRALASAGLAATTPILVVENASLPRERPLRTTLERLAGDITTNEIASPAVMIIGDVARMNDAFQDLRAIRA
jgi:uroporphyrin-III C-methyltransferase